PGRWILFPCADAHKNRWWMRMFMVYFLKSKRCRVVGTHPSVKEFPTSDFYGLKVNRCCRRGACNLPNRFAVCWGKVHGSIFIFGLLNPFIVVVSTPQVVEINTILPIFAD